MLQRRLLVESPVVSASAVRCPGTPEPEGPGGARAGQWSVAEPVASVPRVVLVRRGVFQRRVEGVVTVVDTATAYLQRPGELQQIAHPAGADVCTSIRVPDDVLDRLWHRGCVPVSAAADLAHRRLLGASAAGRPEPVRTELAVELLAALVAPSRPGSGRGAARSVVEQVRMALATRLDSPLTELAQAAGLSPWYLSRLFHQATGSTISSYRSHLRARAALDALAAAGSGRVGLARLAADHGYADQAHLTRALRRETGLTPTALRALLTVGPGAPPD